MPITYCEKCKQFHLSGGKASLVLRLDEDGAPLILHMGAKLGQDDLAFLLPTYNNDASFTHEKGRRPLALPALGEGYFGTPAVAAIGPDGNDFLEPRYVSHAIVKGKPKLEGLPATYAESDDEATTLILTCKDARTGLVIESLYTVFETLGAFAVSQRFLNQGDAPLRLTHAQSLSLPLFGKDFDVIHLRGAWARERAVERLPLGGAAVSVSSGRGASGHEHNPFLCLARPDTTEFAGEAFAVNLVYSGSFKATAEVNNHDDTRLSIGLNPDCFEWTLQPGEAFQTPEAVLSYSDRGLNGMSQLYHELYRTRLCRGYWRDRVRPALINNWEGTTFFFDEEKILAIAEKGAQVGLELFVLDDGWFGVRNDDNCSLGDWVVNKKKLPNGIDGLAKKINDMGLLFGLWFEPEMISPDSDLYRAHPDWCLHAPGRARMEQRNQLILDLSRADVQDYIVDALSSVLSTAPIAYVKWDMNRNMSQYGSALLPANRQRSVQHKYMLGLYRVLETLVARFPKVLFEGCSGGGGRFDAGMLYYMPQIWTSDDTDPVERLGIQYGTSFAYPAASMGAHVSASPNHQTGRATTMQMRGGVALAGNFGYELDMTKMTEEELAIAREQVALIKDIRQTLQQGVFTRLVSPFETDAASWQFLSRDGKTLILCYYQTLTHPNGNPRRAVPRDLEPDALYALRGEGLTLSGNTLMHVGLPLPKVRGDFHAHIFILDRQ